MLKKTKINLSYKINLISFIIYTVNIYYIIWKIKIEKFQGKYQKWLFRSFIE